MAKRRRHYDEVAKLCHQTPHLMRRGYDPVVLMETFITDLAALYAERSGTFITERFIQEATHGKAAKG